MSLCFHTDSHKQDDTVRRLERVKNHGLTLPSNPQTAIPQTHLDDSERSYQEVPFILLDILGMFLLATTKINLNTPSLSLFEMLEGIPPKTILRPLQQLSFKRKSMQGCHILTQSFRKRRT